MPPERTIDVKKRKNGKEPELIPLPGPVGPNGQLTERQVDIASMVNKQRSELLAQYGCKTTGNAEVLKERLREFSRNRAGWNIVLPSYRGNLKAQPEGSRKKKTTRVRLSEFRREALFGQVDGVDVEGGGGVSTALKGPAHGADLLAWSERSCAKHPYVPPRRKTDNSPERQQGQVDASDHRLRAISDAPSQHATAPSVEGGSISLDILQALHELRRDLVVPPLPVLQAPTDVHAAAPTTAALSADVESACEPAVPQIPPAATVPPSLAAPRPTAGLPLRTLVLPAEPRYGIPERTLEFTDDQICNVPVGGIGTDIALIARLWDCSEMWWRRESPVHILGHPIPLFYWRELLAERVPAVWTKFKSMYIKWRDAALEFRRFETEDDFWARWSNDDGKRRTFTQITSAVRAIRMDAAKKLENMARARYGCGAVFADKFSYRKSGQLRVYQKPAHIAQRFIELQDLEGTPVDQELRQLVAGVLDDM
ncbi:hypothetical protein BD626DRAFT_48554 [Schizophyllum amplum]|uniref:SAP domain-containing protein n=1 Tax=Schizophyllum amplum TaxID=97359 RepID=A0A550BSQ0_9AGAR|nr:hypothetical protein BD626DRAFT_48554 [Auriculariopsis ampla]